MSYPSLDDRDYSYTAFQTAQGDNSFPGTQIDNDLDNLWAAFNGTADFLAVAHDSSGAIKAGSITSGMLASSLTMGLAAPTNWATATAYAVNDTVTEDNGLYLCLTAHTSGTFATDLAAAKWQVLAEFAPLTTVSDGAITEAKLASEAVTTGKIGPLAVTGAKIAAATLTADKAAVSFGNVPVGAEMAFAGPTEPAGWLFEYGQAVSRTTYASLFSALSKTATATVTNASNTLTVVSEDLQNRGFIGAVIEGAGIVAGTTIVAIAATTITLSVAANSTGSGRAIRILPHGAGDGTTTFNVPDRRGRVIAGRDDMGGTAAARLTNTTVDGTKLGSVGGAQTHALVTAELAAHLHTVTDPGHTHGVTDPGHTHTSGLRIYDGLGGVVNVSAIASNTQPAINTGSNTTGVTVDSGTTGITTANAGSGTAHNNVQPSGVANMIIFAGV